MTWPFGSLRPLSYSALLVDPPWDFECWSKVGSNRAAYNHYPTMSNDEIGALPIGHLARRDCVLFLWILDTHMPFALAAIAQWGFTYKKIGFIWTKTSADGSDRMSTGYWTRNGGEVCLLATCGNPKPLSHDVRQVIRAKPREHSRKPDEQYGRIERLANGPYCELFARSTRCGWDSWGNDVGRFVKEAA